MILFLFLSQVKANTSVKNGPEYSVSVIDLSLKTFYWNCSAVAHIFMERLTYHTLWELLATGYPKSFITKE